MERIVYTDVMVDVETTGLDPEHAAIIQIGAVPFNFLTEDVESKNMFCQSLTMPPKRFWTSGTDKFWLQDNREVYLSIMEKARPYKQVIDEFYRWACQLDPDVRFWSKGHLDWSIIESYMLHYGYSMPFNFRQAKDMRSFIAGMNGSPEYHDPEVEKVGDHHNALHDCLTQLKQLFKAKDETCQMITISD